MKIDRLLSIVIMLLNRKRITAKDLADYFEVSIRTIQRDIEAINMAGIPIVSYRGQYGGYGLLDNYKIDKNFLSDSEHKLLLVALEGINRAYEDKNLKNVIEKLTSIKSTNDHIKNNIIMDFSPWGFSKGLKEKIDEIKKAIEQKEIIRFTYINLNGQTTQRTVEPYLLALKLNHWYLQGYCRLRQDFRLFKLTRIKNLSSIDETFETRENNFDFSFSFSSTNIVKLKLKFHPKALNRLDDYFEFEKLDFNEDGYIYISIEYPEDEWVYSMILSFGDWVEVIEPIHIRQIIKNKAKNILKKYKTI
ncbi:helix-turn-helix transcriptional regulator [Maledivibacter halophilus]|uniref:Predicted DNA-binding transcriptional regulator YafY, contains an HTH and WYL domains n=1 Tax=Maledivibacter halophilus TaxID=36842 RepID=A0A1T5J622_9FIRM|nr:YafY family protein [Maledivibacter halophilus]SKC46860.1 Predicted DNA-binding transcriptional regulator YafY, contains an HTH and WYL domains [Maledivibacter halophilus]